MNRAAYYTARKAYRLACARDAVETEENDRAARLRYAYAPLHIGKPSFWPVMTRQHTIRESLSPRDFAAITSRPSTKASGRIPRGPRAMALCGVQFERGQYANLHLAQRVALRRALRQIDVTFPRPAAGQPLSPDVQSGADLSPCPADIKDEPQGFVGGASSLSEAA